MMSCRNAPIGVALLCCLAFFADRANAAAQIVVNGILRGGTNVVVEDNSYTVRFVDGQILPTYPPTLFAFRTINSATAAAQALNSQLILDTSLGSFNSNPSLTYGCTAPVCKSYIPFMLVPGPILPSGQILPAAYSAYSLNLAGSLRLTGSENVLANQDLAKDTASNIAVFTKNVQALPSLPTGTNAISQSKGKLVGTIDSAKSKTIVITHGIQFDSYSGVPPTWTLEMQREIQKKSPEANVLIWTWPAAYASGEFSGPKLYVAAKTAEDYANESGLQLATALKKAGVSDYHFIGHSVGNYANAYAADYLIKAGIAVKQVTILDRPFGNSTANSLLKDNETEVSKLRALLAGVKWVDNYYGQDGSTGGALLGAYNYQFSNANHEGVHERYFDTINGTEKNGFYWSLTSGNFDSPSKPNPIFYSTRNFTSIGGATALGNFGAINTATYGTTAAMSEGSPAYLWADFFIDPMAEFLIFDYLWSNRGDGDSLELYFGDDLIFSSYGLSFDGNEFISSGQISVAQYAGQMKQLTFYLHSVGEANADLLIRDVSVFRTASESIPEPKTLWLFACGIAVLFLLNHIPRSGIGRALRRRRLVHNPAG